jgi:hypothetical protein
MINSEKTYLQAAFVKCKDRIIVIDLLHRVEHDTLEVFAVRINCIDQEKSITRLVAGRSARKKDVVAI